MKIPGFIITYHLLVCTFSLSHKQISIISEMMGRKSEIPNQRQKGSSIKPCWPNVLCSFMLVLNNSSKLQAKSVAIL